MCNLQIGSCAWRTNRNEPLKGGAAKGVRGRSEHYDESAQSQEHGGRGVILSGRENCESYGFVGGGKAEAEQRHIRDIGEEEL